MKEPSSKNSKSVSSDMADSVALGPDGEAGSASGLNSPGKGHRTPPDELNKFDPRKFIGLALAYWWLIMLFVLIGAGAGAAYCVLGTPRFRAMCSYQIFVEKALSYGVETTLEQQARELGRQINILSSDVIKSRVKNKLAPEWENRLPEQDVKVEVVRDRRSPVMQISVDAPDEEYAIAFLRELISAYEERRKLDELEATERSLRSLRLEKDRLSNELTDARERLKDFQQRHNLKIFTMRSQYEEERLASLMERLNSLRMESAMIEMQLSALEDASTATIQDVLNLTMETHLLASGGRTAEGPPPRM